MTQASVESGVEIDVDLDSPVPCAHSEHKTRHVLEQPASYWVSVVCPGCGGDSRYPMCASGWIVINSVPWVWHSKGCGQKFPIEEVGLRIISVL